MKLSCRLCLFSLTGSQRGGTYTRKQNDRDTISMHETCQILKCKGCLSSFVFYYLKCTYVLIQWFSLSENKHKRNHNHTQNQRNATCTLQSGPLWPDFNVQVFVPSLTGGWGRGKEGERGELRLYGPTGELRLYGPRSEPRLYGSRDELMLYGPFPSSHGGTILVSLRQCFMVLRTFLAQNRTVLAINRTILDINRTFLAFNRTFLVINRTILDINRTFLALNRTFLALNRTAL